MPRGTDLRAAVAERRSTVGKKGGVPQSARNVSGKVSVQSGKWAGMASDWPRQGPSNGHAQEPDCVCAGAEAPRRQLSCDQFRPGQTSHTPGWMHGSEQHSNGEEATAMTCARHGTTRTMVGRASGQCFPGRICYMYLGFSIFLAHCGKHVFLASWLRFDLIFSFVRYGVP